MIESILLTFGIIFIVCLGLGKAYVQEINYWANLNHPCKFCSALMASFLVSGVGTIITALVWVWQ